jgi:putative phage-type endonuclease
METQHLVAGTPEWHAHRATHFNASDAPAMLGCSPYMTRTQLLHKLHTGLGAEHDAATERRFADGHRFEALARPIAEQIIGDDLAPVVGTLGELSASFDGLTLMGDTAFEHKTLNDELRALPWDQGNGYYLPKHYRAQMEQQLLVSGAERVLFMATKWTPSGEVVEERHCWYASDPALRAEIIAGWKQFAADLATYKPAEAAPVVVAAPVTALPAVSVQVSGAIDIIDNFKVFETALRDFIEHRLIREPSSDQDFADLDSQIKALKGAEAALDAAEAQMLAQVASVDAIKRTKDMLHKLTRDNRLVAEKLLASEKERRRGEIVTKGRAAYDAHVESLKADTGGPWIVLPAPDFAGKVKGLRTIASIQNAVDTELAAGKIVADESARKIRAALACIAEDGKGYEFLLADRLALIGKPVDDLRAIIKGRIAEHQAAEAKKEADTRERIRLEEQAKAEREAREKIAAEQRQAAQAATPAPTPAPVQIAAPAVSSPAVAANVVTMPTPQESAARILAARLPSVPDTRPPIRLGQIGDKLGFTLTADFLKQLGFEPAATEEAAKLYRASDEALIYEALVAHIRTVAAKQLRAA